MCDLIRRWVAMGPRRPKTSKSIWRRLLTPRCWRGLEVVGLWAVVLGVAGAMTRSLYVPWISGARARGDFADTFIRAGRAVAGGSSPYVVHTFVYPPLLALLLAPFSHLPADSVFRGWEELSLAAFGGAAVAVTLTNCRRLTHGQFPILLAFCLLTTYHFWPVDYELGLGQTDLIVLCVVALSGLAASRREQATSGFMVGLGAFLKTWPVALFVFFLPRGRWRGLVIGSFVLLAVPIAGLATGGVPGLTSTFGVMNRIGSPWVPSYSAWKAAGYFFSVTPLAHPLLLSAPLKILTTVVLVGWIGVLLALTLRLEMTEPLAFWNALGCVVLLLPSVEFVYTIYLLPILWLWTATVLVQHGRGRLIALMVLGILLVWWKLQAGAWNLSLYAATPAWRTTLPFFLNLGAVTASVLALEILRRQESATPAVSTLPAIRGDPLSGP